MTEKAIEILKQNNLKITKQRKSMLDYLSKFQHYYVDVTQVDDYIRELYPGVSHNTIYRNIKEFEELGILESKDKPTGKCVKYQCDFANMDHHHFICKHCGKVQEIKICPFNELFAQQLPGCQIEGHSFEIHGYCADCKGKINKS
ncbi:Fur family transcriptional regulator [Ligilactobacillus ceti]|uniref:Ferric uptake regulation protein n=1 Tax=Ligilactobacillus ceti DSM 22408 TaxID=1122146 RepID=A0A0R2KQ47_9LACO|nr:Fur family transcriptional regulator [Ligilactobacillus ceti]KRN88356.1 ferric uptake regulation protein [Ligilactobacillus ceti DSM 22408]